MRMETVQYYSELQGELLTSEEYAVSTPYVDQDDYDYYGEFPDNHFSSTVEMGAAIRKEKIIDDKE